mmetsp:Transcript_11130/g.18679  ORF Transcript_11130/g.18679 Transcript_11130/m.18679 type:complete len:104 (+) Transcript_11130:573-884(+)
MFIENSHVQFLESAGARAVPLDFRMEGQKMRNTLAKLDGVYIPGDSKLLVDNHRDHLYYIQAVQKILQWAQEHNEKEGHHFPVMGVGYGCFALIKSQLFDDKF